MTDTNPPGTTTDLTIMPPAERAAFVLGSTKTEADLREMLEKSASIAAVADKNGRELAHSTGMMLKRARTTIERIGKAAREDATAFSNAVIAEEKRLKAITADEEARIFALRDAFDHQEREEAERQERVAAARREKIAEIRRMPLSLIGASAAEMMEELQAIVALRYDAGALEAFGEQREELANALREADIAIVKMHARQEEVEAAAFRADIERQDAERERAALEKELTELRAEKAAREAAAAPVPAVVSPEEREAILGESFDSSSVAVIEAAVAPAADGVATSPAPINEAQSQESVTADEEKPPYMTLEEETLRTALAGALLVLDVDDVRAIVESAIMDSGVSA